MRHWPGMSMNTYSNQVSEKPVIKNFPEEVCSRESWLSLTHSYRGTLTVGFGSGTAVNPCMESLRVSPAPPQEKSGESVATRERERTSIFRWLRDRGLLIYMTAAL